MATNDEHEDDEARTVTVVLLDSGPRPAAVLDALRESPRLTPEQITKLHAPARLPQSYTEAEARTLVDELVAAGAEARLEQQTQSLTSPADEEALEITLHPGVSERPWST